MFVVTADQKASRSHDDAVPEVLAALAMPTGTVTGALRPFERTVGDEIQALYDDPVAVTRALVELLRRGQWWVGVGIGAVQRPLPTSARAGRGPAYLAARAAVEAAKSSPTGVCVRDPDSTHAADRAEAATWLLAALLARRTRPGWEVTAAAATNDRQVDIAADLGISPQAVSRRLRVAGWPEQQRGEDLLAWLLGQADHKEGTPTR